MDEVRYFCQQLSPKLKRLKLYCISDIHYGNPNCHEKRLDELLYQVKEDKNAFIILNGDLVEAAIRTSKGEIYEQTGGAQKQRDWVIEKFKPLKNKVLGCTIGNHEARIQDSVGMDIAADIAYALECPYRRDGMLLKISFGDNNSSTPGKAYSYFIYFSHGYGSARTSGAKLMKLERVASYIDADVYVGSHDHTEICMPISYLIPDPRTSMGESGYLEGKVKEKRRLLVKSGAFLKWGGYSEAFGYAPAQLGTPRITFAGQGKPFVEVTL